MPSWARSLQFRLTLGFTLILGGALLSVSAFAYATTERKIDAFSEEISIARAERLDQVVSASYSKTDSWEGVQDALETVGQTRRGRAWSSGKRLRWSPDQPG